MSTQSVLLEQFTSCYDQDDWFVSLKTVLEGVTAEQADWSPEGTGNSIRETVDHLIFWNERWLQRYRGELNETEPVDNDTTFRSDLTDWAATVEKLFAVMYAWRFKLNTITDEKLNEPVNSTYTAPWRSPLAQQNIHNAYHIGQILLLRKLQGAWDPEKGVS